MRKQIFLNEFTFKIFTFRNFYNKYYDKPKDSDISQLENVEKILDLKIEIFNYKKILEKIDLHHNFNDLDLLYEINYILNDYCNDFFYLTSTRLNDLLKFNFD